VSELRSKSLERRVDELESALHTAIEIAGENAKRAGRIEERIEGDAGQYRSLQTLVAALAKDVSRLKRLIEEVVGSMFEARLAAEDRQERRDAWMHELIQSTINSRAADSEVPSNAESPHESD
jgi:hypothetical protein